MSRSKRRCLLITAIAAWIIWGVAFTASLLVDVGAHHIIAQYAVMALAFMLTLMYAVFTATTPIIAGLNALIRSDARTCPSCTRKKAALIHIVPMQEHAHSSS